MFLYSMTPIHHGHFMTRLSTMIGAFNLKTMTCRMGHSRASSTTSTPNAAHPATHPKPTVSDAVEDEYIPSSLSTRLSMGLPPLVALQASLALSLWSSLTWTQWTLILRRGANWMITWTWLRSGQCGVDDWIREFHREYKGDIYIGSKIYE